MRTVISVVTDSALLPLLVLGVLTSVAAKAQPGRIEAIRNIQPAPALPASGLHSDDPDTVFSYFRFLDGLNQAIQKQKASNPSAAAVLESSSAAQLGLTVADFQQAVTQARFARALFQHLSAELLEYQKNIATAKQLPDPKRLQELDSRKEAIRREAMFQMQRAMPRQGWTALQTHLNQVFVKP